MPPYDPDNIFARIIAGELPSEKVYEDDATVAVMDVYPQSRGHVLVIPKAPARNLLDADPEALRAVVPVAQRVARAMMGALGAAGIRFAQFNEAPAGQTVFHLHFHLIPVYTDQPLGRHAGSSMADPADLAELAASIKSALD